MTWTAFHNRGDVLRSVTAEADARLDGTLPSHLDGVAETFRDDLDLVGVLQLRWHTRLAGRIERALSAQPMDLEAACREAWAATADELPGIRLILDRQVTDPATPDTAQALEIARAKDRTLLALMAGLSSAADERAIAIGARIEAEARATWQRAAEGAPAPESAAHPTSFVERIKAVLAA